MKLLEKRKLLVGAIFALGLGEFKAADLVNRTRGLAQQNPLNAALEHALVVCCGRKFNTIRVGKFLQTISEKTFGNLQLQADYGPGTPRWTYRVVDVTAPKIPLKPILDKIADERLGRQIAVEDQLLGKSFLAQAKILDTEQRKYDRAMRRIASDEAHEAELALSKANRKAERAAAKAVPVSTDLILRSNRTSNNRDTLTVPPELEEIAEIGESYESYFVFVNFGSDFMSMRQIQLFKFCAAVLKNYGAEFLNAPLDLVIGRRIPPGASRDPRDYQDYSSRAAFSKATAPVYPKRGDWSPFNV